MAEQIIQTLGFDAGDALITIKNLTTELGTFNAQLAAVAQSASLFNKNKISSGLTKSAKSAKKAGEGYKKLDKSAKGAGKSLKGAAASTGNEALDKTLDTVNKLSISWQTLGRVVLTQAIVRTINLIKDAIGDANEETRELTKRIAEIQTIAGNALGDNIQVDAGLTATSTTFGFDVLDVAEAKYQELSNQVAKSTESIEFQTAAAKLARATNSSLTDSVNLLSSSLNAFGKDANQSEEVAGLLFKTIEQGRVRASELANTLGRVAPLANALGVSFNELGGAIARITQGGTKADTALTQVLGIFNKLSKPTPELAAAFKELGVATAQQGIQQSGGLLNFLKDLEGVAGSTDQLVDFFNNVRAIQGVLALLKTDIGQTEKVFDSLAISTEEAGKVLNDAFSTATEGNVAVEYEQAIQELNATMRNFAKQTVPAVNQILTGLNFLIDGFTSNLQLTGTVLGIVTVGTYAWSVALTGTTLQTTALAGAVTYLKTSVLALGPVAPVLFGVAAGLAVGNWIGQAINANRYAEEVSRASASLRVFEALQRQANTAARDQARAFREAAEGVAQYGRQFRDLRRDALSDVENLDRNFVASTEASLRRLTELRGQFTNELVKSIKNADKEIERSRERSNSILAKKDDFLLSRRIKNLDDNRKAAALFDASRKKAFDTKDLIQGVTDLDTFDAAAKALEQRLSIAQKGLAAADASGNRGLIARAEEQVATALNDQLNLEKQRQQLINKRRQDAEKQVGVELAKTEQLKALTKDIRSELSLLSDSGQIKTATQLEQQGNKVAELVGRLSQFAATNKDLDFSQQLGISNLINQYQTQLEKVQNNSIINRDAAIKELEGVYQTLNGFIDDNVLEIGVKLGLVDDSPDQIAALIAGQAKAATEAEPLTEVAKNVKVAEARVIALQDLLRNLFVGTTGEAEFLEQFNGTLDAVINNANVTEAQVKQLADALSTQLTFAKFGQGLDFDLGGPDQRDSDVLINLVDVFDKLTNARRNLRKIEAENIVDLDRLKALNDYTKGVQEALGSTQSVIDKVSTANSKTGQLDQTTTTYLETLKTSGASWDTIAKAIERAAAASKQIRVPEPAFTPSNVTNRMNGGGMLYRNGGGAARGQDKIPAMLSAGEFVMNSGSSRKFASQLVAMNAGANPTYRSEGGSISNTVNVGDINVNGTANADDTARQVVSQLRREFRRGTASRFN